MGASARGNGKEESRETLLLPITPSVLFHKVSLDSRRTQKTIGDESASRICEKNSSA